MRRWIARLLQPPPPLTKLQHASHPRRISEISGALMWAYRNGYRPVPGYTVCERREDGTLYVAIEMTKEK